MSVYRDLAVDIPGEHVVIEKRRDGSPAVIKYVLAAPYDRKKGYAQPKRTTIGYQCGENSLKMHPTSQYARIFPDLWEKALAAQPDSFRTEIEDTSPLQAGLFAACQVIQESAGLKELLEESCGCARADALLEEACRLLSQEAKRYSSPEEEEALCPRESKCASRPQTEIQKEQELLFRRKWAARCRKDGADAVWIRIGRCMGDGLDQTGKPPEGEGEKTRKSDAARFWFALTPEGKPISYEIYPEGRPFAEVLESALQFLRECVFLPSGVILDSECCSMDDLSFLSRKDLSFAVMFRGLPREKEQAVLELARRIRLNAEYLLPQTFLFALQQPVRLSEKEDMKAILTVFYDYRQVTGQMTRLLNGVYREMDRLEECLKRGEEAAVKEPYRDLLTVSGQDREVLLQRDGLQKHQERMGVSGIVTSRRMTPQETRGLYESCESFEMLSGSFFCPGDENAKPLALTDAGTRAAGFLASVYWYEIGRAAKSLGLTAGEMAGELLRLEARKVNGVYLVPPLEEGHLEEFFAFFHRDAASVIAETVRQRNSRLLGAEPGTKRRKSGSEETSAQKPADGQERTIRRKPGVPRGTKRGERNQDGTPRRKPGVKAGTKRGFYNQDGSVRKKPGPKPKTDSESGAD